MALTLKQRIEAERIRAETDPAPPDWKRVTSPDER